MLWWWLCQNNFRIFFKWFQAVTWISELLIAGSLGSMTLTILVLKRAAAVSYPSAPW